MHFCEVVAREYGRFSLPRKTSLNWFIPALVKSSVGSSCGTSGELGTIRCPLLSKYFRKDRRMSLALVVVIVDRATVLDASLDERAHARGVKALAEQVAMDAPCGGQVG